MPTVNQERLYPHWNKQKKLQEDMTRKALDLPDDDMNITANRGTPAWVLAVISLGAMAVVGWAVSQRTADPVPPASGPADSSYRVEFFDQHGDPIDVPIKPAQGN